jgi:predicted nucleic acid-binding protein
MNADAPIYLDSSALVKLVVLESESPALVDHLRERPSRVSCGLARVEVIRAVRSHGEPSVRRAKQLLERISVLRLDETLLDQAAALNGAALRSLDAIHLAAAQALGDGLAEVITYDHRMADAARQIGLPVAAPA